MLACSHENVITVNDDIMFERRTPTPRGKGATSCEHIDIRIRNGSQEDEVEQRRLVVPSLMITFLLTTRTIIEKTGHIALFRSKHQT